MKLFISVLFFGILHALALENKTETKTILLISTNYSGLCSHVAFRVTLNKIEIDSCYDSNLGIFKSLTTIDLNAEPILKKIFETTTLDLKKFEEQINASKCDFINPIILKIKEREVETIIEWKGIQNCYPKSMRKEIVELEKLFEKYR